MLHKLLVCYHIYSGSDHKVSPQMPFRMLMDLDWGHVGSSNKHREELPLSEWRIQIFRMELDKHEPILGMSSEDELRQ